MLLLKSLCECEYMKVQNVHCRTKICRTILMKIRFGDKKFAQRMFCLINFCLKISRTFRCIDHHQQQTKHTEMSAQVQHR